VYTDTILVEDEGRLGAIEGTTVSEGSPVAGAGCSLVDEGGVPWGYSGPTGEFELPVLVPNTYDLLCERDGYLDALLEDVEVAGGATTDVGPIELLREADADGDGIPDTEECSYVEGQPPVPDGDANRDGKTDGADYTVWADNFGKTPATFEEGDLNCDDIVDGADYTIWADNFGNELPGEGGGAGGAPEPAPACGLGAELALLALLGHGLRTLRRRRGPASRCAESRASGARLA
jgi:hypothetical protein